MVETVRETIERVMREQGNFNNPLTINTPIGSRTFYERDDSPLVQKSQQLKPDNNFINRVPVVSNVYDMGQKIGEFVADVQIAKSYKDQMDETGRKLVNTFGKGQGADIDEYYHPLLQCQLSHISPQSQTNGLVLGYAKEGWDYVNKRFNGMNHQDILNDSPKDLQNNLYGSTIGASNPNESCLDLLDDRRTPNMRKLNIR